jgi:hypothetical protein
MLLRYAVNATATVRTHLHTDGKNYLIAPTVAIVEGVMNDILYLEEEIASYIEAWNGRPLIIDHPTDNEGEFVSANSPELLPNTLGFYYNAVFEDAKLKGEWWIDTEKAKKIDEGIKVLTDLKAGKVLEQSTGLFVDIEEKSGTFNGVPYTGIARNIRPDHVAILLHDEGACSVKDGCGTPRVNSQDAEVTSVAEAIETATTPRDSIILDITSVVETIKTATKNLSEVVTNLFTKSLEVNQMTREELIQWIIDNSPIPYTIDMLNVATDDVLQAIAESMAQPEIVVEEENPEFNEAVTFDIPPTPTQQPLETQPTATGNLPESVTEFFSMLEEHGGIQGIKTILEDARDTQVSHFDGLVEMLATNTEYKREDLQTWPIEVLKTMAAHVSPNTPCQQNPIYANRVAGSNMINDSEWEPYTREVS